jgi:hypothetical protein
MYFGISVISGFSVAPSVQAHVGLPEWPVAFLLTAALVTLTNMLLDWSEKIIPELLTQAANRIFGHMYGGDTKNGEVDK